MTQKNKASVGHYWFVFLPWGRLAKHVLAFAIYWETAWPHSRSKLCCTQAWCCKQAFFHSTYPAVHSVWKKDIVKRFGSAFTKCEENRSVVVHIFPYSPLIFGQYKCYSSETDFTFWLHEPGRKQNVGMMMMMALKEKSYIFIPPFTAYNFILSSANVWYNQSTGGESNFLWGLVWAQMSFIRMLLLLRKWDCGVMNVILVAPKPSFNMPNISDSPLTYHRSLVPPSFSWYLVFASDLLNAKSWLRHPLVTDRNIWSERHAGRKIAGGARALECCSDSLPRFFNVSLPGSTIADIGELSWKRLSISLLHSLLILSFLFVTNPQLVSIALPTALFSLVCCSIFKT